MKRSRRARVAATSVARPPPEGTTSMTLPDLLRLIEKPAIEYRPELRWWLAEGLHTDETLRYEIDTAHRLGFGGMEFLAMDEGNIDHARYGWGSEEGVHDSRTVAEETPPRNMSGRLTSRTTV